MLMTQHCMLETTNKSVSCENSFSKRFSDLIPKENSALYTADYIVSFDGVGGSGNITVHSDY